LFLDAGAEPSQFSLELARALAEYLGDLKFEELIALFLATSHGALLQDRGISDSDVAEAADAIRRYRRKAAEESEGVGPQTRVADDVGEIELDEVPPDGEAGAGDVVEPIPGAARADAASEGSAQPTDRDSIRVRSPADRSHVGPITEGDQRLIDPAAVAFGRTVHVPQGASQKRERRRRDSDASSRRPAGDSDPIADRDVEDVAIAIAKKYGESLSADVIDVQ
jgi:hypothetical protein